MVNIGHFCKELIKNSFQIQPKIEVSQVLRTNTKPYLLDILKGSRHSLAFCFIQDWTNRLQAGRQLEVP